MLPRPDPRRWALLTIALALALGLPATARAAPQPASADASAPELGPLVAPVSAGAGVAEALGGGSLAAAIGRVLPAVVVIQSFAPPPVPGVDQPPLAVPAPWRKLNTGAGVVLQRGPRKVVLTCQHLVDGGGRLILTRADGAAAESRVLASDATSDLAVLELPWPDLPPAPLADDHPRVGDLVFSVGHPFEDYPFSVSAGIVSFDGRTFEVGDRRYTGLLQTDAAMNRGSSGGPLCDARGDVVGLQVAIFSPTGTAAGLGFAVPIAAAAQQADRLLLEGGLPWLGLTPASGSAPPTSLPRPPTAAGVVVEEVVERGPAATAGLLPGDRLLRLAGAPVHDLAGFEALLWQHAIGETITLGVLRDGQALLVDLTLGRRPASLRGGR